MDFSEHIFLPSLIIHGAVSSHSCQMSEFKFYFDEAVWFYKIVKIWNLKNYKNSFFLLSFFFL